MKAPARLGLIGDVHGAHAPLGACLAQLAGHADLLLCTGDIVEDALDADAIACCRLLADHDVLTVRGNHDRWWLRHAPIGPAADGDAVSYLRQLPPTRRLDTVAGPLLLGHGIGSDDMIRLTPDDHGYAIEANLALQELLADHALRWLVGGHTHLRMARRLGTLTVINPGALCHTSEPGWALLDLERLRLDLYDVELRDGSVAHARTIDLQLLR